MSIKIGITDDEKNGRDFVAELLKNEFPLAEIVFMATSVKETIAFLKTQKIDLLLLDIALGDGNAFDILQQSLPQKPEIIFITAYDHYAIQAIKQGALDYILKPIELNEFKLAIQKAIHKIKPASDGFITLSESQRVKRIAYKDIIRCEADSNYTVFYLKDQSKIVISKTLAHFEQQLKPFGFFRVHHKNLINLSHFKEFVKDPYQVVLSDDSRVEVSVRKKSEFLQALEQFKF